MGKLLSLRNTEALLNGAKMSMKFKHANWRRAFTLHKQALSSHCLRILLLQTSELSSRSQLQLTIEIRSVDCAWIAASLQRPAEDANFSFTDFGCMTLGSPTQKSSYPTLQEPNLASHVPLSGRWSCKPRVEITARSSYTGPTCSPIVPKIQAAPASEWPSAL